MFCALWRYVVFCGVFFWIAPGDYALSIDSSTYGDAGRYFGCYKEILGENARSLSGHMKNFGNRLTHLRCTVLCYSMGFLYAGTQNGNECYCGDKHPTPYEKVSEEECSKPCTGDLTQMCGNEFRNSVRETGIPDVPEHGRFKGCFSGANGLPNGLKSTFEKTNTPRRCMNYCWYLGFKFSAVKDGKECHCGNELPKSNKGVSKDRCNQLCSGDSLQYTCGGKQNLAVYSTLLTSPDPAQSQYVGCYVESKVGILFNGMHIDFPETLTPEMCIRQCFDKGFSYAGTQFSVECFCKQTKPPANGQVEEKQCDSSCSGDKSKVCGGTNRYSVYSTGIPEPKETAVKNLGCFKDFSNGTKLMSGYRLDFPNTLTPELCIDVCKGRGFIYAGMQRRSVCYCDNMSPSYKNYADSEECLKTCDGNSLQLCGSDSVVNVFQTGVTGSLQSLDAGKYLGCFKDGWPRVLTGFVKNFGDDLTPIKCSGLCYSLGFLYAGAQNGNECFCGNEHPIPTEKVEDGECLKPCSGEPTEMCGSDWRNSVRATDFSGDEVLPLTGTASKETCNDNSVTIVNGKKACKGEVVFEDEFTFLDSKWKNVIMIPEAPDYEFVVFNDNHKNLLISKNQLVIKPTILEDEEVLGGSIELQGCTANRESRRACGYQAFSYNILPPVQSARINTRQSFTFRYGIVEIRAKLPIGDYLVPELWLEPKDNSYGPNYASGRIRIAMSRGNRQLHCNGEDAGISHVEAGVLMGSQQNVKSQSIKGVVPVNWHDDFHTYTLIWKPDSISFKIDNEIQQRIVSPGESMCSKVGLTSEECTRWKSGSKIAPFDKDFYISLGLSAGNSRDFPDHCIYSGRPKTWKSGEVKALLKFWQDKQNWASTWSDDKSALFVEYIRVTAL